MSLAIKAATRLWFPEHDVALLRACTAKKQEPPDTREAAEASQLFGEPDAVLDGGDGLLPAGSMLPRTRVQIRGRVGEGGGGIVYRGVHVDLKRTLAIKVQQDDRPDARESFLAEARAAVEIDSPHVVQVVDFGELPDGRAWYAMEYLGGRSLARVLDEEGALSPTRTVALLRMACRGLAATHAAGVVHCDVKPDNLVAIRRAGVEHLVIVDFGIAMRVGERAQSICGTPEYMAPEQIEGIEVDARADLYSLGCCAYEMLTGRSVVSGADAETILRAHIDGVKPRWPDRIPVPLRQVIDRCLALDPAERFADAQELETALCHALSEAGLAVPEVGPDPSFVDQQRTARLEAGPPLRRHMRPHLWLAAVAIGLLMFAAGSMASMDGASVAAASVVIEGDDDRLLAGLNDAVAASPDEERPDEQSDEDVDDARTETETPANVGDDANAAEPVNAGEDADAGEDDGPAGRVAAAAPPEPSAAHWVRVGRRELGVGDRNAAEQAFRRALQRSPHHANALAGLSDVHFESGRHDRALHFAKLAVRYAPNNAAHRVRLGDAYYRIGRHEDAHAQYERAAQRGSSVAKRRLTEVRK